MDDNQSVTIDGQLCVHLSLSSANAVNVGVASYEIKRRDLLRFTPTGSWEVAAIAIDFPVGAVDLCNTDCYLRVRRVHETLHVDEVVCQFENIAETTPAAFVTAINTDIQANDALSKLFDGHVPIEIRYDSRRQRVGVAYFDSTEELVDNGLYLSHRLGVMLGFTDSQMPIHPLVSSELPCTDVDVHPVSARGHMFPYIYTGQEFIYVSLPALVRPYTLVNDKWTSCVLQVPLRAHERERTYAVHVSKLKEHFSIASPIYFDVATSSVHVWRVDVYNELGQIIRFYDTNLGSFSLQLHFRRKTMFGQLRNHL